jgi:hypothetical protein
MTAIGTSLARALIVGMLAVPAAADTWIVDSLGNPGFDFYDLQTAIDQSAPGDVLLVRPGQYAPFQLERARTILGLGPGVAIAAGSRIGAVPLEEAALLAVLELADLRIEGALGPVVLDELRFDGAGLAPIEGDALVSIRDSADVRVLRSQLDGSGTSTAAALVARTSRVEIVQSQLLGAPGTPADCGVAGRGGDGISLGEDTLLHGALTGFAAGAGGPNTAECWSLCGFAAGDGGEALELGFLNGLPSPAALLAGSGSELLLGGPAGQGTDCACDGYSGHGIRLRGGTLMLSQQVPQGGAASCAGHASGPAAVEGVAEIVTTTEPWPTLAALSAPATGEPLVLELRGPPGASVRLDVGLRTVPNPSRALAIGELLRPRRSFDLGSLGSEGRTQVVLPMPAGYPRGSLVIAQAHIVGAEGPRRSNSVSLVLR